ADGLGRGQVHHLRAGADGAIWASTEGGLSRIARGHVATLNATNGLPCDGVHWSLEDDAGAVWLFMPCGLVRVPRTDLDAWSAAIDNNGSSRYVLHVAVFDSTDGIRLLPHPAAYYQPQASMAPDGRIWFSMIDGVGILDPRKLRTNTLPPPVDIQHVVAHRPAYESV